MARLIETLLLEASAPSAGVLPNVKVLGAKSRNKREYTPDAMRSAVSLYEGATVYVNHAGEKTKHRSLDDRFGKLKNVRFDEQRNELRGDLEYLESHPAGTRLKEDIERKLNYFGLSHDADGVYQLKGGVKVVTQIDKVNSVDLVSNPATAISLLEQEDAPAQAEPSASDQAMSDAFSQAVLSVLQDGALDTAGKVEKIKLILEKQDEINAPAEKKDEPAQEQTEIQRLTEQLAALSKQVAEQKPRKYIVPGTTTNLTEQTQSAPVDGPPKDKAALKKWLLK
ncbi:hypothetical protein VT84_13590 [Gemmata sp. SH-PL17]|uniref:hypothetical protein n=1 Tax=Gemmata sp. SH-PL17 TaxID=1630693 RepID=UPI00078E41A2|nr:hypothetical protein [Gemmata sp. SH-PL17]AMV25429.1 hypothetical protein VT84_13590 [Gemmata sp. SH-PL17]